MQSGTRNWAGLNEAALEQPAPAQGTHLTAGSSAPFPRVNATCATPPWHFFTAVSTTLFLCSQSSLMESQKGLGV